MVDQARHRTLCRDGAEKGLANQVLRHAFAHRVSHDLSGEEVFVAGEIEPALGGGDVSDIRYPDLIGGFGRKVLLQKIFGNRQCVVGVRCRLELFHLLAANAMCLANALDPVDADLDTMLG